MNFKLRPYQEELAKDVSQKLARFGRVIACAATGSGKTKTFVWITHQAIKKGKAVLILTESRKIFEQITDEFDNVVEIKAGVKELFVYSGEIYVGMAQTLGKRKKIIEQFKALGKNLIVINDEAHIGTSTKVLMQLLDSYIIGFTATPRWKEAKHLTEIYNNISIGKQPSWLVENGYLSPYYHFARVVDGIEGLKIKGGEYDQQQQREIFETAKVYNGIFEDLKKFDFKKAIIFCSNVEHSDNTTAALNELGFKSVSIHSKSDSAAYDMHQFKTSQDVNVCVSVGMLTKGFDFPPIDLVILNRATTSLPLYLQMVGRGSRVAPGKEKFTVVDYGGNAHRHGLWITNREWEKLWCEKKPPRKKLEMSDLRDCPECGFMCERAELVCPSCGYKFAETKKEEDEPETVLKELTDKYNGIRGKRISELSEAELFIYREFSGKKQYCLRIARAMGKDYLINFAKLCGYKNGFLKHNEANTNLKFNDLIIR
jgi:superfamily II DNA or RNA helicase